VLQALRTLTRLNDYKLTESADHAQTPIKASAPKSSPDVGGDAKPGQSTPQTDVKGKGGDKKQNSAALGTNAAR
jgi:hypothetical protein